MEVNIEGVDELYDVENRVLYKGILCEPRSLRPVMLKYNVIYIVAPKNINPTEYGFERLNKDTESFLSLEENCRLMEDDRR